VSALVHPAVAAARPTVAGRVRRVVGLHLEVAGVDAAVGDEVRIEGPDGPLPSEVVAVREDDLVCMPFGDTAGLHAGMPARGTGRPPTIEVGDGLLGRVLDGLGRPLDGRPLPPGLRTVTCDGAGPHPLERARVEQQLPLGVKVLDTLIPCGRGQRLGIFAGSGVGKSSLLSMIARGTEADVAVLALVGERGREVREFIEGDLGPEGLARSVVVVATSDEPPLVRLRAALTATRIAESFRDQGRDVVLLMDSVTRVAMAQREIGLSAGEPPATRGYPPSVFALLPRLLERAGTAAMGSITGLYTVLVEGDDLQDPVGDAARSILDGHVVLSRALATSGHFPTVDPLESVSRVVPSITTPEQRDAMVALRRLLAAHRDAKDLIDIGAYVPGSDPLVDRAMAMREPIRSFLTQDLAETVPGAEAWAALHALVGLPAAPPALAAAVPGGVVA
jgi:flagellum-specific ATP synthase